MRVRHLRLERPLRTIRATCETKPRVSAWFLCRKLTFQRFESWSRWKLQRMIGWLLTAAFSGHYKVTGLTLINRCSRFCPDFAAGQLNQSRSSAFKCKKILGSSLNPSGSSGVSVTLQTSIEGRTASTAWCLHSRQTACERGQLVASVTGVFYFPTVSGQGLQCPIARLTCSYLL